MIVLALDPGTTETGYTILNEEYKPLDFGKVNNEVLVSDFVRLHEKHNIDLVVIEQLSSYGNIIGDSVLLTAVWTGRFHQKIVDNHIGQYPIAYVKRKQYVTDLTGNPKAKDSNVRQYLVDRFEPNASNNGKGTKKNPSRFYGMSADEWQSTALCVWMMDKILGNEAHL